MMLSQVKVNVEIEKQATEKEEKSLVLWKAPPLLPPIIPLGWLVEEKEQVVENPLMNFCDIAVGNSQPFLNVDVKVGNSQSFLNFDVGVGNSQPFMCNIGVGNSQPFFFCDAAVGHSEPFDLNTQNTNDNDYDMGDVENARIFEEENEKSEDDDEESTQDQQVSQPDIYAFMRNDEEDNEENAGNHNGPLFISDPSPPPAVPAKRRRILGEVQLVPSKMKPVPVQSSSRSIKKKIDNRNQKDEGLRFVPSNQGGFVVNIDSKKDEMPYSKGSSSSTMIIGDENSRQRTHAAIRLDPMVQRFRLGLSKRKSIPPLHTQVRPRRPVPDNSNDRLYLSDVSSQDENEED